MFAEEAPAEKSGTVRRLGRHTADAHDTLTMRTTTLYAMLTLLLALAADTLSAHGATPAKERADEELLKELDRTIEQKDNYQNRREQAARRLKAQAARAKGTRRVELYKSLYTTYAHYQTDSARRYLMKLSALPEARTDAKLQTFLLLSRAEILAVEGMYTDALHYADEARRADVLSTDSQLRLDYYRTQRTLHGWMADYAAEPETREMLAEATQCYRDSILQTDRTPSSRRIVEADNAIAAGRYREAIALLEPYLDSVRSGQTDTYVAYTMAHAALASGDTTKAVRYLALTATADLRNGTTEYQALPQLAKLMHARGDIRRAYAYLLCSMEDAAFCKARLRSVEASDIFPVVSRAYEQMAREQRSHSRIFTAVLALMLVAACAGTFMLLRQTLRLKHSRRRQALTNEQLRRQNEATARANATLQATYAKLSATNEKLQQTLAELQQTNETLRMSDKMKEEYIARYLNRCRSYLDTLAELRRMVVRMLKEKRHAELIDRLKSEELLKGEQEKFSADFDAAFLTLFPDFIDNFNAMLEPEARIYPKRSGRLTTELRIYALIRLGVTDTAQIAHFLNNSTATIYSYRSKIRRKALDESGTPFEERVQTL